MGTFLDFTKLYVYVNWMFFHFTFFFFFFLVDELLAKSTILLIVGDIVHIWTDGKVNYFGYCYLCLFLHGPFVWITIPSGQTVFLFYAVM